MPYAILGTGRSGTSMVARMLNLCGLYMGPEELVGGFRGKTRSWNPRGYWEHPAVQDVVDRLFDHYGGSWENPPELPRGWERDPALRPLYRQAEQVLRTEFGERADWAWKLPKATVAMEFWRQAVPNIGFIICVRNPLDFAASMQTRCDLSRAHLLAMWQYYNYKILASTRPAERYIVFYEEFFPCYEPALFPLLDHVGLERPVPSSAVAEGLAAFHDAGLKHYASGVEELLLDETVPYTTRELYVQLLCGGARGEPIPMLSHSEMLLPLMQKALVGEGALDEARKARNLVQQRHRGALQAIKDAATFRKPAVRQRLAACDALDC